MNVDRWALVAAAWIVLAGCAQTPKMRVALATPYKPSNLYGAGGRMPASLRRVAVLPLPRSPGDPLLAEGAQALEPLVLAELRQTRMFEVVPVSSEDLRSWTRQSTWSANQQLPPDLFPRLRQSTGCDAVLFATLTAYSPYPPLRVGWTMRLVDCGELRTWWAVDEVFNAGSAPVAAAALAYGRSSLNLPDPMIDDPGVLASPRRFGQYTLAAVFGTLPGR